VTAGGARDLIEAPMAGVATFRESLRRCACWLPILVAAASLVAAAHAQPPEPAQPGPRAFLTDVDGVIGVATARQISRAIDKAKSENAVALILRLDTPGGLVSSTREIIKTMIASPVPVIVYVAPSGARAASAGTYITYAAHVAAMAPGTNIGAATPIELGMPGVPQPKEKDKDKRSEDAASASQRKSINDMVALMRSLAQLRSRNAEWAEKAVREAATLTASEALKERVIEIVADSPDEVLAQADGRKVTVNNVERTLTTKGAAIVSIAPDWRTRALSVIADPNVAFILLMIGFYGILLEFWHPGTFVPGVIGAISLILALTALSALPVHYGALGLLILGIALMIGEALTPGFGILGVGGLVAFVVGAIFLFEGGDRDMEIAVSLPLIIGFALTTAALIFGVIGAAMQARKRPTSTGAEQMIGSRGEVVTWEGLSGQVRVLGEIWAARGTSSLKPKDAVRVVAREGLTLIVEP
jgi:membrane-bound serine protease (ClpP class)